MDAPAFPKRWKISAPELIAETFSSRIWKVRREDGSPAIVKALKPFDDVEDELRGEHYLAWRRGEGAVRLLGRDGHRMLLEYAGDTLLSDVLAKEGDNAATAIAAELMGRLFSPTRHPAPPDLQPLRTRFASLFKKAGADRDAGEHSLYIEAAEIADRLLDAPHAVKPLHGDLHHDNILHGARGWLAIDPKGVVGDPGFDAANLFYNPLGRDDLCLDPERIAHMAEIFARTLGQTPAAILDHAIAYGCLSAAWHHEDENAVDENRELSVAGVIRKVRLSF
ncbi:MULTISPECIES: aminoglycoside phosphotransferase family protein [unclassified Mesorhizobium]|uniref:aminoglycoside phosphotransferase family protein n=1 Tax=unclassified Mesorhizobium TaxID=325217 RepID=UPI0003CDFA9E|nr:MULTISPECIES: aminoglycoside phosphotransferase family protein [unclassified Mesorhizobium]ESY09534.1 StrB [Mesorhizobium sp. LNJC398B00]ESY31908.1 StrB [Mesorhizobium sp. LNJC386A00]ESY57996.1 StrB [Mesorhizobium sp. LNJC374B00]ESY58842.1 StrB [Mesorhizobium sp. LNJC372A00]ESZ71276.1 StrB [Mesorhizobium sp. L103C119B0]